MTSLLEALGTGDPVIAAELRPPRAELDAAEGMDAWIDTYHAIRRLTQHNVRVFLTDSAIGTQEENNLRHLATNVGKDVSPDLVVPFLTTKHSREFCLSYAEQAGQQGFHSLVVLGGDKHLGRARCVEHAWQLRRAIRDRVPQLVLGGWANPHGDVEQQLAFLTDANFTAEYYLTQIVSHHEIGRVEPFVNAIHRRNIGLPGMFGVFYYRSARLKTLETLSRFLPVPVEKIAAEFAAGATAEDICARTLASLLSIGVRHFYISNLPLTHAAATLESVLARLR